MTPSEHEIEPWEKAGGGDHAPALHAQGQDRGPWTSCAAASRNCRPALYDTIGYYERWIVSLSNILVEKGVLDRAELDARVGEREAGA